MNVVPGNDLLRSGVPQLGGPSMINMNHSFMSQQQQHPQGQHQQGPSGQMGLLQNNPNPTPMFAGGPPNNASGLSYPLHLQQANMQNRQQVLLQNAQGGMNRQVPPQQMNGMGGHNPPLSGMPFSNGIMNPPQQQIRRVTSQPASMNHAGAHMGGMPQGMGGIGGMSLGLNQGQNPMQHMRPGLPQQYHGQMRPQQQPHAMQGHVSPDMSIPMSRPPQMPGNGGLPPHVNRAASAQSHLMSNLGQPSGLPQQHPGGMQGPIHQAPFNGSGMLVHHQPQQLPGASPHTGTHSQNHTPANFGPNMPMGNIPPSQTPANRSQPPGENSMLMGFPNQQPVPPNLPHVPRIPQTNNQFPFAPSSTSPNPPVDMAQNVGGGQMNGPVHGQGSHHHITTPAQLVDRMNHPPSDTFSAPYNLPQSQSQPNVPTRPPSQQRPQHPGIPFPPQQPQQPHHQSPRPGDPMVQHMGPTQRPQSQQGQQRPSPPQAGPSRTPRVSQPPLPNPMAGRVPIPPPGQNHQGPPQQQQQPQPQGQGAPGASAQLAHQPQIAPRQPPPGPPTQGAPPQSAAPAQSQQDGTHHAPHAPHPPQPTVPVPHPVPAPRPQFSFLIGQGQAIARLLQMSGDMAVEKRSKEIPYWENFVRKYFTSKATMKITLWKENQRQEAKPFEIGTPILPRFFNVTTQSGVKSMSLTLDGARERLSSNTQATVDCPEATWTYRYENGYNIVLRGPFTAHLAITAEPSAGPNGTASYAVRIEQIVFDSMTHEKLINIEDIEGHRVASSPSAPLTFGDVDPRYELPRWHIADASFPAEPINAFGVPQATMRCLELAESVTQMGDLIQFSQANGLGPREALRRLAQQLREEMRGQDHGSDGPSKQSAQSSVPGPAPGSNVLDGGNGSPTPPSIMYPGTPGSSSAQPGQAPPTPQNTAHAESSKQGKASQASNAGQGSSQTMASTPSASTPAAAPTPGGSTPAMANATLKRKAGQRAEPESPAVANSTPDAPAPKRAARKRARTGTQGGG